jgi:Kef-type K+ transport system membrane component KefB
MGVSIELACFLAGVAINTHRDPLDGNVLHSIETVRDFLGCIFFATIGMHVYPSFLLKQAPLLLILTLSTMGFKAAIMFSVGFCC